MPDDHKSELAKSCPQSLLTGFVGAGIVTLGAVLLPFLRLDIRLTISSQTAYIGLTILAFLAMAFVEVVIFRVYRHQFDFSRRRMLSPLDRLDLYRRYGALCLTLSLAWVAYTVLGEYGLKFNGVMTPDFERSWYKPFFRLLLWITLALPILGLPYFWICGAFGKWPREEDEYLRLWKGYLCLAHLEKPDADFFAAVRSLLVKLFFVPVMTVFLVHNAQSFDTKFVTILAAPWGLDTIYAGKLFDALYEGVFLLDVNLALLGYVCCFRIMDSHIRWAEPTLLGWAVALACYPPFNTRLTGLYLPHDPNSQTWSTILTDTTWLYYPVGVAIILLIGIYLYATIAFGFRFSNLTHRGIICRGPYAWVRHPAYVAKNISWWLISLPFLTNPTACSRLLLLNVLYVIRALTEERNLSRDPVYREYMARVKYRFIPGFY